MKPHIWFQQKVPAKQKRELELKLRSGNYILRERDRSVFMRLNVSSNNPDGSIDLPEKFGERTLDIGNNIKFVLENPNPSEAIYVLENILWEEDYLRPGDILCRKDFRDIFSEDSLKSDVILQVGEQSILFTDIVQSTNIYKELGDQKAFYLVKKHFDTIFSLVKQNNGVVVKTIGDSVMASFYDPVKAITTALQIHEQMENLENSALSVRISINKGNCLAVKLNTGLDYFGSVVNEAAKLQILVNSKQTILSESILADNSVKSFSKIQEIELDEVYCNHISNNFNSIAGIIQIEQPKKVSEKQNNLS